MKTKEEILKKIAGYNRDCELEDNDDITIGEALEAMEEYASQFKTKPEQTEPETFNPKDFKLVDGVGFGCMGCCFTAYNGISCLVAKDKRFNCTKYHGNQIYKRKGSK